MTVHLLDVKLRGRTQQLRVPDDSVADWLQSFAAARPAHRRRLTRAFLATYAGDPAIYWVWASPMRRYELLTLEQQDEVAVDLISALQSLAPQRRQKSDATRHS